MVVGGCVLQPPLSTSQTLGALHSRTTPFSCDTRASCLLGFTGDASERFKKLESAFVAQFGSKPDAFVRSPGIYARHNTCLSFWSRAAGRQRCQG